MTGSLEGKTAIVTGASRGIGSAIGRVLHDDGATVILTARTQAAADAAAAEIGPRAHGFEAHATSDERAEACVRFALERTGRVDVLVNNAGTNPAFGSIIEQDHARFTKTIDVNLWAPLMWSSLCARHWMLEHGGTVVNVASLGGLVVGRDLGVYHVSKAALIHLTRQLAFELGPAIRANAIAPGLVRTRLAEALWRDHEESVAQSTPLRRIGEPADIASLALFLASDASSWMTGETVVIDGGQMLGDATPAAEPR